MRGSVWLRSMPASLPVLQPHLGAISQEHSEHSQDIVRQSLPVSAHLSFFLSPSLYLCLLVFISSLSLFLSLLSLSSVYFCVFLCQSFSSPAVHPLTSFCGPASFFCFLVAFVPLLQGFVCDFDVL